MSHFSLSVFHYQGQDLDSLLAPFDANAKVEKHIEFTRQEAIDYARAWFPSCAKASDEKCWNTMAEDATYVDEEGNLYSTSNPNTRWDWWTVGGRWRGLILAGGVRVSSAPVKDIDFTAAPFVTFAILTPDGEWYEQESWIASDEEAAAWKRHYKEKFIDTADPDMILTIVDYHI